MTQKDETHWGRWFAMLLVAAAVACSGGAADDTPEDDLQGPSLGGKADGFGDSCRNEGDCSLNTYCAKGAFAQQGTCQLRRANGEDCFTPTEPWSNGSGAECASGTCLGEAFCILNCPPTKCMPPHLDASPAPSTGCSVGGTTVPRGTAVCNPAIDPAGESNIYVCVDPSGDASRFARQTESPRSLGAQWQLYEACGSSGGECMADQVTVREDHGQGTAAIVDHTVPTALCVY